MKKTNYRALLITCILVSLLSFLPKKNVQAAKPLFTVTVNDGYKKQKIRFYYGKTTWGYNAYFADKSVILVHPKAKKVTFKAKSSNTKYGNFQFQSKSLKPTAKIKSNLFTYYTSGKRRAYMFTVRKINKPTIKSMKITYSDDKRPFTPDGKSYINIKTSILSEAASKSTLTVENAEGIAVYQKAYKEAMKKTYSTKWFGKASKNNPAGLKASSYVPAGKYTIKWTTNMKFGKSVITVSKEKVISVGGETVETEKTEETEETEIAN